MNVSHPELYPDLPPAIKDFDVAPTDGVYRYGMAVFHQLHCLVSQPSHVTRCHHNHAQSSTCSKLGFPVIVCPPALFLRDQRGKKAPDMAYFLSL